MLYDGVPSCQLYLVCTYVFLFVVMAEVESIFYTEFLSVYSRSHREKSGPYILASTYSAGERKRKGNACLRPWNQAMKCHYFTSTITQTTFHSIRQCSPAGAYKMRRTGTKAIADREGCRYWYRGRITAEH